MSIWTSPVFRPRTPGTPASPVAVRADRLRVTRGIDVIRPGFIGYFIGLFLFFAELSLGFAFASVRFAGSPKSMLLEMLRGRSWSDVVITLLIFIALAWIMPLAFRFQFDLRARYLTRESLARQRRWRHRTPIVLWIFAALLALAIAAMTWNIGWQPAALVLAKFTASWGGALSAVAPFSRRGTTLTCRRCDYPMKSWRGSPSCCSECGNAWHTPWKATLGTRRFSLRSLTAGLSLIAMSALLSAAFSRFAI